MYLSAEMILGVIIVGAILSYLNLSLGVVVLIFVLNLFVYYIALRLLS